MVTGEHAESAGVDRQRLMQRELGREVRNRLARQLREAMRPPGIARRTRGVESGDGAVVDLEELRVARGGVELLVRDGPEHADRIVGRPAPEAVIEPAEDGARLRVPAPPEIEGELFETSDAFGKR